MPELPLSYTNLYIRNGSRNYQKNIGEGLIVRKSLPHRLLDLKEDGDKGPAVIVILIEKSVC